MHCTGCVSLLLAGLLALSHSQRGEAYSYRVLHYLKDPPNIVIAPGNTNFAFRLYHVIASQNPGRNIFFSPLSISFAYSMLSLGTNESSQTQILESLGFNLTELSVPDIYDGFRNLLILFLRQNNVDIQTHVGLALFLHHEVGGVLPSFVSFIKRYYNSAFLRPDFTNTRGTAQLINTYARKKTNGQISYLVSRLSQDMKMVLVNFIYFKGLWEKPFPPFRAMLRDFHMDEKTTMKVPMMWQFNQQHWYLEDKQVPCSVLRMDYKRGVIALFILPNKDKMQEVERALSPELLSRWLSLLHMRDFYERIALHFPKFSVSGSYELDKILPKMGFENLFSTNANFSGMVTEQKLKLSKSFHKASMNVNEVGTEVGVVTSIPSTFLSSQQHQRVVMFDRPFFVAIFSNVTQCLLFLGKVVNPMES